MGPLRHLRGLNIVDVVQGETRKASVTVSSGRIAALDEPPPENAEILDLDGCWATPSFVDMHAHVTFEPRIHDGAITFAFDEPAELGALRAVQNLTEALRNGICLVRDAGGRQSHLAAAKRYLGTGHLLLPDLVTSGEPLCRPDGHGSVFGQHLSPSRGIGQLVEEHAASGHEWLKIMNGPELWHEPELAEIVSSAHHAGLLTAVHAFTPEGIRAAVRAGATTVEHGMVADPELIAEAKERSTAFVPTAYCSWISLRPRFTRTQPTSEVAILDYWYRYLDECRPPHLADGLPVLPGTDAGCAPCTFDDYVDELIRFERWGTDPLEVLRNATIRAAQRLGRAELFGSIDVGKWANLIVTERDPTAGTTALRHPALVLYKGSGVVNTLGERWP
ncbi:amidohydrolase family protein [Streptomyces sp. 8N616]|uniref:amidohydrolase family protein n=1 Tax=Streptomyces sp. 8N616 TaxID=3457414 RepID=UPI003FD54F45